MFPPADQVSELTLAWAAWETWCGRTRNAFSPKSGKTEAARLTSAVIGAAIQVGVTHMELHDRIASGRRDGLSIEQAVGRALH